MQDADYNSMFVNWLSEHSAAVMKVARAYTLSSDDCQDLAQEILLQSWKSLPNFDHKSSVTTWFYRVALNTAMNWNRKDKPRRSRQRPFFEMQFPTASTSDTTEQAQQRETIERLYQAIHQLPVADTALVLLYLDELSYKEMSEILGISESNVGVKLTRVKKTLRDLMEGQSHEQ